EYLEEGIKSGREFTRDELDHRVILYGDLDLTRMVYESIEDKGQDRYLTITLAFREDHIPHAMLDSITQEFKQFMMYAYKEEEFNFYAEAHLPKIKTITDKKTGEPIDRKPHIHIVIPKKNLLSGNIFDPVGSNYAQSEKHLEAFQEYVNNKYNLSSPREHVRADIKDAASVLSRYKGDDFYGKNRQFKQDLVKQVIEQGIQTRSGFYALVGEHGETRVRNKDKANEYIAVKLPGDAKFTNLKDTIFHDDFIVRRELKKPPLDQKIISDRLLAWPQRAKEIKYISKAGPDFRKLYVASSSEERVRILNECEQKFYQTYGESHDSVHTGQRQRDHQRSSAETAGRRTAEPADGLQDLSVSNVADHRQAGSARSRDGALLLPSDAHVHLGQSQPGGDSGLRPSVPGGGRGRRNESTTERGRGGSGPAAVSQEATGTATPAGATGRRRTGAGKPRNARVRAGRLIPPYAKNPHRVATIADIEERGRRLFDPLKKPSDNALVFYRAPSVTSMPKAATATAPGRSTAGRRPRTSGKPRPPRQWRPGSVVPPYAKNPHRVATVADIEQRARMLFEPLKRPADKALVFKRASIKALTVNRQASTVAAYFTREAQHNRIAPAHRQAIRRIDQQYFALRRAVFSDQRLTRQDKAQLVSVLTFERLKAREQFHKPQPNTEVNFMGSAAIRNLLEDEKEDPGFSISGARGPGPAGVRDQVKRVMDRFAKQIDPVAASQRARDLSAKDLYTRKAKFSQNVHYLDKQTDKTLFVDTGKSISMRRTGITESGVSVALQLAKERFGSTLTITGTAEFKKLVIEAVAKNGLDVHFTDKAMNQSLADRRAELDIERDGLSIGPANDLARHVDDSTRDVRDQADRMGVTVRIEALYGEGKTAEQVSQALAVQLDTVPESERIAFVEKVAITLGIPERGEPKGDQAFAQWQAQRAQPAADSEATARSEAQADVSTPSDTAPEAVTPTAATNSASASPEAAKPARVNDPDLQSPSELVRLEAQWRRDFP
ncbi:Relaxase, partial [Pseudomonas coronafaciens pv. garcae]